MFEADGHPPLGPAPAGPGLQEQLAGWTREVLATFGLILVGLVFLFLANWLVLEPGVRSRTDATRATRELHEGMLVQESALRAYVLTGDDSFLSLYAEGQRNIDGALGTAERLAGQGAAGPHLHETLRAMQRWTEGWAPRALELGGRESTQRERTALLLDGRERFTAYRLAQDRLIAELVEQREGAQRRQSLAVAWTVSVGIVLTLGLGLRAWHRARQLRRSTAPPLAAISARLDRMQAGDLAPAPLAAGPAELVRVEEGLAAAAAALAAADEERAAQAQRIATQNRDLGQVLRVAREIAGSLNLRYVVQAVTEAAAEISGRRAVVWLREDGDLLVATADSALPGDELAALDPVAFGEGPVGRATRHGRVEGRGTGPADDPSGHGDIAIPLVVGAQVVGVLQLCRDGTTLEDRTLDVIEALAVQAASAVASARLFETTEALARTDALTRLPNRRQLDDDLATEVEVSVRYGRPLAFAMLDVDHFKSYNDELGHQAGDVALQQLADVLSRSIRAGDQVYRYGGEEIAVLLRETDAPEAWHLLDRLRTAVEHHFQGPDQPRSVTISAGVASAPAHATQVGDLVRAADAALYAAKRGGRNRVVLASAPIPS